MGRAYRASADADRNQSFGWASADRSPSNSVQATPSTSAVELMQVLARACGHRRLQDFERADLSAWSRDVAELTGVRYAGVGRRSP